MKVSVSLFAFAALASVAMAGTETSGKDFKATTVAPAPPECWYGDTEWDVSLWGTYAFTGTESNGIGAPDFFFGENKGDRYMKNDHSWGGGVDAKYFWHKYFGFGIEGMAVDAKRSEFDFEGNPFRGYTFTKDTEDRAIGAVLGTFTIRVPIGCSRFAPYAWAGGGAIFGGGETDTRLPSTNGGISYTTHHSDSDGKGMGQFGGGFEVRITRHIGWMNDFSWNVVDGPKNNFGMVRTGLTVAF
jgi:hypothetical protein